jgi:hypothetical protein
MRLEPSGAWSTRENSRNRAASAYSQVKDPLSLKDEENKGLCYNSYTKIRLKRCHYLF